MGFLFFCLKSSEMTDTQICLIKFFSFVLTEKVRGRLNSSLYDMRFLLRIYLN
jgi:hypothetical protein